MDATSLGVLGQKLANEQIKAQGQMAVSLVAQAQATGDAARAQTAQTPTQSATKAPPPQGMGAAVDISA